MAAGTREASWVVIVSEVVNEERKRRKNAEDDRSSRDEVFDAISYANLRQLEHRESPWATNLVSGCPSSCAPLRYCTFVASPIRVQVDLQETAARSICSIPAVSHLFLALYIAGVRPLPSQ